MVIIMITIVVRMIIITGQKKNIDTNIMNHILITITATILLLLLLLTGYAKTKKINGFLFCLISDCLFT